MADELRGGRESPRKWVASQALNRPLMIAGCERTWFILNGVFAYALYTATYSLAFGAAVGAAGYALGVAACRQDPGMLRIVKVAQRFKARYDPAKRGSDPGVRLV